jgi:hypothetical protein
VDEPALEVPQADPEVVYDRVIPEETSNIKGKSEREYVEQRQREEDSHMRQGKPSIMANVPTGPPNSHLQIASHTARNPGSSSAPIIAPDQYVRLTRHERPTSYRSLAHVR